MLVLTVALLAGVQAAPVEPDAETHVTVIARRLANWSGRYRIRGERVRCTTTKSSGDRAIDAIGCAALETCAAGIAARYPVQSAKTRDGAAQAMLEDALRRELGGCVTAERKQRIAALAEQRRAARAVP